MNDDIGASARLQDAPAPDDPRKPGTPPKVRKRSWLYAVRRTIREFGLDQCIDSAGSLTYFGILSGFPALLAVFSLLGVVGQRKQATEAVMSIVKDVAPGSAASIVRGPIEQFASSPVAGFALIFGIVLAIWSASGYVGAFARAMNRIYEIDEGRPFWKRKPQQLLITLVVILLVLIMVVVLIVSGPVTDALGNALGAGAVVETVWSIAKWPLLAVAFVLMIALLYYATPNVQQPRFRWVTIGGVTALVLIVLASLGFGIYVANFSHYNKSYGSLAGIIIFLIWLWITNLALLFGAELDAELERGRELQGGIQAEDQIKLPPRDATASKKKEARARKEATEGRALYDPEHDPHPAASRDREQDRGRAREREQDGTRNR